MKVILKRLSLLTAIACVVPVCAAEEIDQQDKDIPSAGLARTYAVTQMCVVPFVGVYAGVALAKAAGAKISGSCSVYEIAKLFGVVATVGATLFTTTALVNGSFRLLFGKKTIKMIDNELERAVYRSQRSAVDWLGLVFSSAGFLGMLASGPAPLF